MADSLTETIERMALKAIDDEVELDGKEYGGSVHRWIRQNVNCREDQEFYINFLLSSAIADELARREGYESQGDKAAKEMAKRFVNTQTVYGLPPKWERIKAYKPA